MADYNTLLSRINEHIEQNPFSGEPAELYEPVNYMMQLGGKRVRPALVLLACNMMGGQIEKALPAALAVEVFHNFTLVHDDIMDKAPVRRGKPTVHTKWNTDIAILAGDLMMIKSMELMAELEPTLMQRCMKVFLATSAEVCEGQQLDMNYELASDVNIDAYIRMIELKTAVLLACSLKLGAYIAGASESDAQHLYAFGRNIGIAFQLQDDILDVYAGESFGKQSGGDIIANKKTFLLIKALELAGGTQRSELQQLVAEKNFDPIQKVESVKSIYASLGVKELAEKAMNTFMQEAWSHLEAIDTGAENKKALANFARALQQRSS